MMRWLKDKKKGEKKGGAYDDAYREEDDYGFEKEKSPNKSPVTRRELPPTPAAPEEKSTHIYEEIPDLHVSCTPVHERNTLLRNKRQGKSKSNPINSSYSSSSNNNNVGKPKKTSGSDGACLDDSISPYMVVPVDEEVRQTPPHFHRNGTPEVHCDLIVKDTHCEVLLSRKPKVGAFRLDSTTITGGESSNGNGAGAPSGIRNNTHFCSWNRRASVDVQPGGEGKGSSAFSWSSSAFSSASTSRVNSMGTSSMSLSTLPEHRHQHHQGQPTTSPLVEGDSGSNGSSVKGVMTYSSASNFIPRSTKLVFKPLTPLDPEMFDDADQDIALRNAELACQSQQDAIHGDDVGGTEYTSVQGQGQPESNSPLVYSIIQNDQLYGSTNQIPHGERHGQCQPASPPTLEEIRKCQALSEAHFRSTLMRPYSPSSSSSCTYASMNFPSEARLYNTIQGLDLPELSQNSFHISSPLRPPSREGEPIHYPNINGEINESSTSSRPTTTKHNAGDFNDDAMYPGNLTLRTDSSHQQSNFPVQYPPDAVSPAGTSHVCRGSNNPDGAIYSGIVNPCDLNTDTTYTCIDSKDDTTSATHTTSSLLQNKIDGGLVLDFCTCQDYQQYSSCGCSDVKGDDDDNASVATTIIEPKSSCSGCGRLIRQITYSESYSDETYEHAYSSRLLLRKGRRFSSPDITVSEISNSESQDLRLRQGSPFGSMSRDDMWSKSQSCDVHSTFYRPDGDGDSASVEQCPATISRVLLNGRDHNANSSITNNGDQPLVTHRKSFCAFMNNDTDLSEESGSTQPSGLQQMKRTSLPTNTTPSTFLASNLRPARSSAVTQQQPKSSAFSGIFSKFSRPKAKTMSKAGESSDCVEKSHPTGGKQDQKVDLPSKLRTLVNPIPEKNTLKLSKLFQRMSVKDISGSDFQNNDSEWDMDANSRLRVNLEDTTNQKLLAQTEMSKDRCPSIDHYTAIPLQVALGPDPSLETANSTSKTFSMKTRSSNSSNAISSKNIGSDSNTNATKINALNNTPASSKVNSSCGGDVKDDSSCSARHQVTSSCKAVASTEENNVACFSSTSDNGSKFKATNKTDSGDTCYEYDISTSSESEHPSYDFFLSKVKKSLNLEKEVQHIADMNALRKKLLCKGCKKDDASDHCEMCDVEGTCTHVSSLKCSDWRKLFGEFVVDQRAAILDCLTDYAHNPYSIRGDGLADGSNHCRECGGEIMTSDSESLTTVYSLLSQHLRMTSPGAHTPSCDSDEGTMADNSCESADEGGSGVCRHGDESSGFDDDDILSGDQERIGSKSKKREKSLKDKRDRKGHHCTHSSFERYRKRNHASLPQEDVGQHQNRKGGGNAHLYSATPEITISNTHSSSHHRRCSGQSNAIPTLQSSKSVDNVNRIQKHSGKDDGSESTTGLDLGRARTSLLATDKAIQDIYAPLPSKALSWLTARHVAARNNNQCACSRLSPSASVGSLSNAATELESASSLVTVNGKLKDLRGSKEPTQKLVAVAKEKSIPNVIETSETDSKPEQGIESPPQNEHQSESGTNSVHGNSRPKLSPHVPSSSNIKTGNEIATSNQSFSETSKATTSKPSPVSTPVRRRSRQLPLAALDLLPETAFGSDVVDDENTQKAEASPSASQTKSETVNSPCKSTRPRLVERMARLFENNDATELKKIHGHTTCTTVPLISTKSDNNLSLTNIGATIKEGKSDSRRLSSTESAGDIGNGSSSRHSRSHSTSSVSLPPTPKARTNASDKRIPHNKQSLPSPVVSARIPANESSVSSKGKTSDPKDVDGEHTEQVCEEGEKPIIAKRRGSSGSNANVVKEIKSKSGEMSSSSRKQMVAPGSPSSSTSSSSSSSLSRRRVSLGPGGQTKQKRLSKKSQLNKKAKSKVTERKKKKKREGSKEEKTYYCFSSDISDIDVMEVEEFDIYSTQPSATESRRRGSHGNSHNYPLGTSTHHGPSTKEHHKSRRDRSASRSRDASAGASSKRKRSLNDVTEKTSASNQRVTPKKVNVNREPEVDGEDGNEPVQEIYAMPPNSSEVCEVKSHRDDGLSSPTASPELRKLRKNSKMTDMIYKTKKSDNRLLSDLIIRNYDRQVFGNV